MTQCVCAVTLACCTHKVNKCFHMFTIYASVTASSQYLQNIKACVPSCFSCCAPKIHTFPFVCNLCICHCFKPILTIQNFECSVESNLFFVYEHNMKVSGILFSSLFNESLNENTWCDYSIYSVYHIWVIWNEQGLIHGRISRIEWPTYIVAWVKLTTYTIRHPSLNIQLCPVQCISSVEAVPVEGL